MTDEAEKMLQEADRLEKGTRDMLIIACLRSGAAYIAELEEAARPFVECLYLDEITPEERAKLANVLLGEK